MMLVVFAIIMYLAERRRARRWIDADFEYGLISGHNKTDHEILIQYFHDHKIAKKQFEFARQLISKGNVIFIEDFNTVNEFVKSLKPKKKKGDHILLKTLLSIVFLYKCKRMLNLFLNDHAGCVLKERGLYFLERWSKDSFYVEVRKFIK